MKALNTPTRTLRRSYWCALFLLAGLLAPALGRAQSTTVVISEVFAGGGNTGALYKNDFVELYNKTSSSINLNGYSVQYNPASGGGGYTVVALGNVSIPGNGYLLVQFGGGTTGATLPTPDASTSTNMAVTGGRVALLNSTVALVDGDPANSIGVVDYLGYGSTATTYEGSGPALGMGNTVSLERKALVSSTSTSMGAGGTDASLGNGYDSNDNANDFVTRNAPEPQNTGSGVEAVPSTVMYYNTKNPSGMLNDPSTFSTTMDGTGPSPASFGGSNQTFTIVGNATIGGNWSISGTNSKAVVANNATFTVPAAYNFTGVLDLNANATLIEQNAAPAVTYGNVDATSTVEFAQAGDYLVPVLAGAGYGNLTLRNASKHLNTGTTVVRGNVLVSNVGGNSDVFGGSSASVSTLAMGGNLRLTGTVSFSSGATDRIALTATNTAQPQVLDGGGNTLKLYSLILPNSQAGVSLFGSSTNVELGNTVGGGYQLGAGTVLTVNGNTLATAAGSKASISGTGALAIDATSSLVFDKNNGNLGFSGAAGSTVLMLTPGSTQINNLTINSTGNSAAAAGTLTLSNDLTVNGTIILRGFIQGTAAGATLGLVGGRTLTMNGLMDISLGFFNAPDASIVVGGAGDLGLMYFRGNGGNQLRNFTMARPNRTLYLNSAISLSSSLNVTDGVLGQGSIINLNGTVTTSGTGRFQCSTNAGLVVNGTGPLGNIYFTDAGGNYNTFTLNRPGGTLNVDGAALVIRFPTLTSGVLHIGNDMSLNITGPLVVDDPAVARFAVTPTSSMSFTSYVNTASVDIGPLAFVPGQDVMSSFTMNRSATGNATSGFITPPLVQLTTNMSTQVLILTRGYFFVQGNNRLVVTPGGAVVGGSANSYTNTLTRASVTNANTGFATLAFPLGVNGFYRPLTFTVTDAVTGTTSYTAHQYEGRGMARTLPPTLQRVSGIRYYNLVAETGGTSVLGSATIRLSYDPTEDQVTVPSLLRVAMADPADNSKWKDLGGNATGSNVTSNQDIILPGPLGDFILATDGNTPPLQNPLPVELTSFSAQRQASKAVSVRWTTASEKNSDRFEVQRSLNGRDFVTIATAKGQGSSSQATAYAALDQMAPAAELYYRLRQVDLDGTVAYSSVLRVNGTDSPMELALYPNPTTDRLTATAPALAERTFRVLNTLGQVLTTGPADAENPVVDVHTLPTGTYLLELSSPAGRQVRRFVKTN